MKTKNPAARRRDTIRDRDVEDSRAWPRTPCWRVQSIEAAPEGYAYISVPGALKAALWCIDEIGGADSPKGPRLCLEPEDVEYLVKTDPDLDDWMIFGRTAQDQLYRAIRES